MPINTKLEAGNSRGSFELPTKHSRLYFVTAKGPTTRSGLPSSTQILDAGRKIVADPGPGRLGGATLPPAEPTAEHNRGYVGTQINEPAPEYPLPSVRSVTGSKHSNQS